MWCFDEVGLCIDHGQEINEVITLGNALGKATQPAGLYVLIPAAGGLERECKVDRIFIHSLVNVIPVPLLCVVTRFISGICIRNTHLTGISAVL